MLFSKARMKQDQGWLLVLICLLGGAAVVQVVKLHTATVPIVNFEPHLTYVVDEQGERGIEAILALPATAWQRENKMHQSFGMSRKAYWFKFDIDTPHTQKDRLLEIDYPLLDDIDIWLFADGELVSVFRQGDRYAFANRLISHEKLLLPVPDGYPRLRAYVKVQTEGTIRMPVRLWDKGEYLVFNGEHNLVMGLFFGFMAAMALSNLFFFVTTRSSTFLTYCAYVMSLALVLATLHGFGYKYLWPENPWLQARSVAIYGTLTSLFALIFSSQLLNVKRHSPLLAKAMTATIWLFLAGLVASVLIPYAIYIRLFLIMIVPAIVLVYGVGIYLWFRGVSVARFYTLAWTTLLLGALAVTLDNYNLVYLGIPSHYLLIIGATTETFMLALVLAISYSQQRRALFESQEIALVKERMVREAQEEMLQLKERAQEELEYKVQERTLELEVALRELSATNQELERKNTTDALTGIRNRSYFDRKYRAEVRRSRREQTDLSIAMVDIDHFKQINDKYGHIAGDECIRFVAKLLKEHLKRPSDDACRYGGEEFALVLPNTDQAGAAKLLEDIRKQLENSIVESTEGPISMTISAGVCTARVHNEEDESRLLEYADQALYRAKRQGRNQVQSTDLDLPQLVSQE